MYGLYHVEVPPVGHPRTYLIWGQLVILIKEHIWTLGSEPEPKADTQPLSHSGLKSAGWTAGLKTEGTETGPESLSLVHPRNGRRSHSCTPWVAAGPERGA
ncbi:small integral membrane protein 3 isoform X1 [Vulpes vulpes]|uniref:Small integral membrane protein 3 isoform X1 n=1 Tax=Vulpes vulpes TaxID=9627 RepID=A0ABM5ADS3_VULVU